MNGQAGMAVAVTPRDPKNLDKVKVGDRLVITYTEAVAVKVGFPPSTLSTWKEGGR